MIKKISCLLLISGLVMSAGILKADEAVTQETVEAAIIEKFGTRDLAGLAAFSKDLEALKGEWDFAGSQLFASEKELTGFIHLTKAIAAKESDEAADFEVHVKEAFWNSPAYAQILTILMSEYENAKRMDSLTLDLDHKVALTNGGESTLREILGDRKGLLLDFWASYCPPCMAAMPTLQAKAEAYEEKGVIIVGVNSSDKPAKAEAIRKAHKIEAAWVTESEKQELARLFNIEVIPTYVLIDAQGKVRYHGLMDETAIEKAIGSL